MVSFYCLLPFSYFRKPWNDLPNHQKSSTKGFSLSHFWDLLSISLASLPSSTVELIMVTRMAVPIMDIPTVVVLTVTLTHTESRILCWQMPEPADTLTMDIVTRM